MCRQWSTRYECPPRQAPTLNWLIASVKYVYRRLVQNLARTDSDGLNLDTILNVGIGSIVGILMRKNILVAEGVDEGSAAYAKRDQYWSQYNEYQSNVAESRWYIWSRREDIPVPEAPQTIKQN